MTILEVGGEGGSLILSGEKSVSGAWSFRLERNDTAAYEALSEEDREGFSMTDVRENSGSVSSLDAAMELLNRYPWFRLIPLEVHPDFRDAILLEVRKRGTVEDEDNWNDNLRMHQPSVRIAGNLDTVIRNYQEGMLVEMDGKPEWGPGKIIRIDGDKLHIIFRDLEDEEAKKFLMGKAALRKAAVQSDPVLDNLPPLQQRGNGWHLPGPRMSFERAQRKFLDQFPRGFSDPRYLSEERNYKVAAHKQFQRELGLIEAREMLASGDIASIISRGSSILKSVNLIAPFASAAFNDAMLDMGAARAFYTALFQLLEAPEINAAVFDPYADAVMSLPALRGPVASWPVATALPFIAQPNRFMLLKPQATKVAAETLAFDLHYDPKLNWATYAALLTMGSVYLKLLSPMAAQDFIDVQTFIFVIGGGYE